MTPTQELIDELYCERILRARAEAPEDKFLDGARLFERVCLTMMDGIRSQFPEADEDEVHRILLQRLKIAQALEENQ